MPASAEQIEAFATIKWATALLRSSEWNIRSRFRDFHLDADPDLFCRETMSANNGLQQWVELYENPAPGSTLTARTVSLCKFGEGLMGFPTTCHGGAVMTMMDEALGWAMIVQETMGSRTDPADWAKRYNENSKSMLKERAPLEKALKGYLVTAHLEMKFLRPVHCPGVVGIEVKIVEDKGYKMKLRAIIKNGDGTPLVQADALWVRLGGGSRL
ncbi:hypothetical protein CC80DRAFT_102274 [Byssothecium circinans]|uniref:Thioesterase domain-containing protein n=1 Tax=Byssothecium circinans TaxID=147558 RepID=A0A6A5UGB6_9PLEO|nr:hypothetical protein CC80DRAFT_102274 [Byssothecium circinans]